MARVGVSWSYYQNKLKVVYILLSQVDPKKKKKIFLKLYNNYVIHSTTGDGMSRDGYDT